MTGPIRSTWRTSAAPIRRGRRKSLTTKFTKSVKEEKLNHKEHNDHKENAFVSFAFFPSETLNSSKEEFHMAKPAAKVESIKKSDRRWQSDIIVDMIKRYGFKFTPLPRAPSSGGLHY